MNSDLPIFNDREADKVAVWICGTSSYFADDVRTRCADCDKDIVHRPHATPAAIKLCIPCALIRRGLEKGDIRVGTTGRVAREIREFFK